MDPEGTGQAETVSHLPSVPMGYARLERARTRSAKTGSQPRAQSEGEGI